MVEHCAKGKQPATQWDAVMSLHTVAYVGKSDWCLLVARTSERFGLAAFHRFVGESGSFAGEQEWYREGESIVARNRSTHDEPSPRVYRQPNTDWLEDGYAYDSRVGDGLFSTVVWESSRISWTGAEPGETQYTWVARFNASETGTVVDAPVWDPPSSRVASGCMAPGEPEPTFDKAAFAVEAYVVDNDAVKCTFFHGVTDPFAPAAFWRWQRPHQEDVYFPADVASRVLTAVTGRERNQASLDAAIAVSRKAMLWSAAKGRVSHQLVPELVRSLAVAAMTDTGDLRMYKLLHAASYEMEKTNRARAAWATPVIFQRLWGFFCCESISRYDREAIMPNLRAFTVPSLKEEEIPDGITLGDDLSKGILDPIIATPAGIITGGSEIAAHVTSRATAVRSIATRIILPGLVVRPPITQDDRECYITCYQNIVMSSPRFRVPFEKMAVDTVAWIKKSRVGMRAGFEMAMSRIEGEGFSEGDIAIKLFVKTEKILVKAGEAGKIPRPRAISGRMPAFAVATVPTFGVMGKLLAESMPLWTLDERPNRLVYATGYQMFEVNQWVNDVRNQLTAEWAASGDPLDEPIAIEADGKNFDANLREFVCAVESGGVDDLGVDHTAIWELYYPHIKWESPRRHELFKYALSRIRETKGGNKATGVKYQTRKNETRHSGEGSTSCGNSGVSATVFEVGRVKGRVPEDKCFALFLGDDMWAITTKRYEPRFREYYATNPYSIDYEDGDGFKATLFTGDTTETSFCSNVLVRTVEGVAFVPDPRRLFTKTFWMMEPPPQAPPWNVHERAYHAKTVASGLLGAAAPADLLWDVLNALANMDVARINSKRADTIRAGASRDDLYKLNRGTVSSSAARVPQNNAGQMLALYPKLNSKSPLQMAAEIQVHGYVSL